MGFILVPFMALQAQDRSDPRLSEGVHKICSIAFDKNPVRPARIQNDALPCLKQGAALLHRQPDRKLVLVGVKDPSRDHEPQFVDPDREEEDATGFSVRLEDLAAYRAVNTKWYLVHHLHSSPSRILPTTDESYSGQTVTIYDVPRSANFDHNFLRTTKINEMPCTVTPCYSSDEESLKAQVRERIVPGTPEATARSPKERAALAAGRNRAVPTNQMDEEPELAPLPSLPTPDKPATTSIIPE